MKNIIFIHIGSAKTATTSLQDFFFKNKNLLRNKYNIYYPYTPGIKNHTNLALYASPKTTQDLRQRKHILTDTEYAKFEQDFRKAFIKEIKPYLTKGYSILLSNEHLSTRIKTKEAIEKLLSLFQDFEIKPIIILYLRRQEQYLFSTYSTWIKSGGIKDFDSNAYKKERYNYLQLINLWKSGMIQNMVVRPFESNQWKEKNIFTDFCHNINIPNDPTFIIPSKEKKKSLDRKQLKFLSLFNQHVPAFKKKMPNTLRGNLIQILETYSSSDKLKLTSEETKKIISFFEATNSKLGTEFGNGKNQSFFSTTTSQNESNKVPELTVEEAVKISAQLWSEQQKTINRLKKNNLKEQSKKYKRGIKERWKAFLLRYQYLIKS